MEDKKLYVKSLGNNMTLLKKFNLFSDTEKNRKLN